MHDQENDSSDASLAQRQRGDTMRRPDAYTIKAAIPPADFYRCQLPEMPAPRKAGWVDGGLCPFHDDKSRGNFRVNLDTGAFKCFACGAKGGDAIAFTMQHEGIDFPEALQELADAWGVA